MLPVWKRNMIALQTGLAIRRSETMKEWTANITKVAATMWASDRWSLFPLKAKDEADAARQAAEIIAKSMYGKQWFVSYVQRQANNLHMAAIGTYEQSEGYGRTEGVTLEILIREYAGAQ